MDKKINLSIAFKSEIPTELNELEHSKTPSQMSGYAEKHMNINILLY